MEVTIQEHVSVLLHLFNQLLEVVNSWVLLLGWIHPHSVQVNSSERTSCVANDDTIYVQHRYDLKHEVVSEYLRIECWTCQVVDDTLHHVTCTSFTWVNTR